MKIFEKPMSHPIHPQHKLTLEYTETPYTCDGCKEAGIGFKYTCHHCEFDLHKFCATATPTHHIRHPFYRKCDFRFHYLPPGSVRRICDACGSDVGGFVYHCKNCGFDLHPCCANLPQELDGGDLKLHLSDKITGVCSRCGTKGPGWSYRSKRKDECNLHVACAKEMLVESWQTMCFDVDGEKVRGMETRLPSLKETVRFRPRQRGSSGRKVGEMAAGAVRLIVSAILGDPTVVIAAVIGSLLSKLDPLNTSRILLVGARV